MRRMLRNEWLQDPKLKKWDSVSCTERTRCRCGKEENHVELWEHDSCVRGRIDTVVCTECNVIVDFDIVR